MYRQLAVVELPWWPNVETALRLYLKIYNDRIAKHLTPVSALKKWRQEKQNCSLSV